MEQIAINNSNNIQSKIDENLYNQSHISSYINEFCNDTENTSGEGWAEFKKILQNYIDIVNISSEISKELIDLIEISNKSIMNVLDSYNGDIKFASKPVNFGQEHERINNALRKLNYDKNELQIRNNSLEHKYNLNNSEKGYLFSIYNQIEEIENKIVKWKNYSKFINSLENTYNSIKAQFDVLKEKILQNNKSVE